MKRKEETKCRALVLCNHLISCTPNLFSFTLSEHDSLHTTNYNIRSWAGSGITTYFPTTVFSKKTYQTSPLKLQIWHHHCGYRQQRYTGSDHKKYTYNRTHLKLTNENDALFLLPLPPSKPSLPRHPERLPFGS